MALIASDFTIQIILLLVAFVFEFGGGFIQKLGSTGLFITGLALAATTQSYVSDLTASPVNVSLFYIPALQQDIVIMFALLIILTFGFIFVDIAKIFKFKIKNGNLPDDFWEYLI